MSVPNTTSFEEWRLRLLADAKAGGYAQAAAQLSDVALRVFWEAGVEPTVRAIIADGEQAQAS